MEEENQKMNTSPYPIIDLFAGPGGLGEGFASLLSDKNLPVFKNVASIERDEFANKTLTLRHFFRSFGPRDIPQSYYDYIAGDITRDELIRQNPVNWREAKMSSLEISLGTDTHSLVKSVIKQRLGNVKKWALVGGPPCQAYSVAGRSRMMGNPDFEEDERHFLYKEYLKTIIDHKPPVFVMENVKGLLSAKVNGEAVVQKIVNDLSSPIRAIGKRNNGLKYKLYSLSTEGELNDDIDPKSFIVKAEEYGVPQARHRMFILGIRSDIDIKPEVLQKKKAPSVEQVIRGMPKIRSGVSQQKDNVDLWRKIIKSVERTPWYITARKIKGNGYTSILRHCLKNIASSPDETSSKKYTAPRIMRKWYYDERLKAANSHESRFHMESDLHRYLFAAAYSEATNVSPKLADFPIELLPAHRNVEKGRKGEMFSDRFRVQIKDRVSTTITSHISKDGHYFIHYDPMQCRSLTVKEAARLQTFPDNYHFEGPRTSQYHQVGNAVPPYLALQIAEIIRDVLDRIPEG